MVSERNPENAEKASLLDSVRMEVWWGAVTRFLVLGAGS